MACFPAPALIAERASEHRKSGSYFVGFERCSATLFGQYNLRSELQPAGALHKATIKCQHPIGSGTDCPVQRICKIESAPVEVDCVADRLPVLNCDVRHSEQM